MPEFRWNRFCGCDGKRKWRWGRRNIRPIAGLCCILLGVLILLICAPEWLVSLIIACLLFAAGCACLSRRF